MNKKLKAALAGLAFVAGCEIGIAIQLAKMIRDYTIKENALNEPMEAEETEGAEEAAGALEEETAQAIEETFEENFEDETVEEYEDPASDPVAPAPGSA